MSFSLEQIYKLVGKEDRVSTLTLKEGSSALQIFGDLLTVIFIYNQSEREEMDRLIKDEKSNNHGWIRAKYLGHELETDKIEQLLVVGINTEDIIDIFYFPSALKTNTFHSTKTREIKKHIITMETLPKGGDLGWMYGFQKRLAEDSIGVSPQERCFFLACKLFCEPENLSDQELKEVYGVDGSILRSIESEFLQIKHKHEEIGEDEEQRLNDLFQIKYEEIVQKLDYYLIEAGSSLKKLSARNPSQAKGLLTKALHFNDKRLNVNGRYPIYIDVDSFLHIYMRHVEEFKINKHFEHKDNFQWEEDDVFLVMGNVIREIENDYQIFREENTSLKYSKYGNQSIYFEGDYYTFHIESNGRISTFHKNKKQ